MKSGNGNVLSNEAKIVHLTVPEPFLILLFPSVVESELLFRRAKGKQEEHISKPCNDITTPRREQNH